MTSENKKERINVMGATNWGSIVNIHSRLKEILTKFLKIFAINANC